MNDTNNIPIKASSVPAIAAISKTAAYAPMKQQKHKHYPGEATKALLDMLIASETFTYTPKKCMSRKILGKIIYRQA